MRRVLLSCVAAAAILAGAERADAVERVWLGPGVAGQTIPGPMLGDARAIVDGLGLSRTDGDPRWLVPRATVGLDLDDRFGVDLTASWFHDSLTATSTTPVSYRVRRDVVPVTGLLRYATSDGRSTTLLGFGVVVAMSRFSEAGWLGDGARINPAAGLVGRIGGRYGGQDVRFTYGAYLQWLYLPRENPLLGDGGGAVMGGLDLGLDFGL